MARYARGIVNLSIRLTVLESRFVLEYIRDGNGKRSVIDAGLCDKSKPQHASNIANKLLKNPRIKHAIQEQFDASAQRNLITVDRIMQEVYRLATYNIQDAFTEEGTPLAITDLPEDLARAIEGFETEEVRGRPGVTVTKYKFAKKTVSQQLLLDRIDAVVKKFEITGPGGLPVNASKVDLSDVSTELLKRIVEKGS